LVAILMIATPHRLGDPVNARARTARRTRRDRTRTQRATARIARTGAASLTTHAMAAGLPPTQARTGASSLRRQVVQLGLTGQPARVHAGRRMRDSLRFTPAQVAAAAATYRPRIAAYKLAAHKLTLAA
jgi:hypothetical protein